jgi:hypothetical protein
VPETKLKNLMSAVNEIVTMTVQSIKTLRPRSPKPPNPKSKIQNPEMVHCQVSDRRKDDVHVEKSVETKL